MRGVFPGGIKIYGIGWVAGRLKAFRCDLSLYKTHKSQRKSVGGGRSEGDPATVLPVRPEYPGKSRV
jgi:hypothetical protein